MKKYLVLVLFFIIGCTRNHDYKSYNNHDAKNVYVVNYSWHSGIILKKNDIPQDLIPEKDDFPNAEFLEIGWGNKAFYQEPKFKLSLATKALFVPGPSTMYVYSFTDKPELEFSDSKVVQLQISPDNFYKLVESINKSFDRKGNTRVPATLKGPYGDSRFYDALGSYGILSTCNNWTAKVLHTGGIPISTSIYSATGKAVMSQIRPYCVILSPKN